MKIELININDIKEYEGNAKLHPREQIEQIKKSISDFGMNDPIGIWKNEIVEGHGRYIACRELGFDEIPVIRLDHLSDKQRKAYTLVHNKLTMNSDFDLDILESELNELGDEIDMSDFGFDCEIDMTELDDETIKNSVIVSINCGTVEDYEQIKPELEELCKKVNANIAVKMS